MRLSQQGELDAAKLSAYGAQYLSLSCDRAYVIALPAASRLRLLLDNWVDPKKDGSAAAGAAGAASHDQPYFRDGSLEFCTWMVQHVVRTPNNSGRVPRAVVGMAVDVMQRVSRADFWAYVPLAFFLSSSVEQLYNAFHRRVVCDRARHPPAESGFIIWHVRMHVYIDCMSASYLRMCACTCPGTWGRSSGSAASSPRFSRAH